MFMLTHLLRSLAVRFLTARAVAKADALKEPANAAMEKVRELGLKAAGPKANPLDIADLIDARNKSRTLNDQWLAAAINAEKWLGRLARVKQPSKRLPSYVAGKLDAAAAGAVLYPYVPAAVAAVKGWMAAAGV